MPYLKFFSTILLSLCYAISANAREIVLSEGAKVSILTCGTGNEVYSLFGHTAIRIKDLANNLDIVYNYGAFDFGAPNFTARFTKGNLQYFVTTENFTDFLEQYHFEKRSVYEQELDMPSIKKQALFDRLNAVLISNERFYTYKFIDRNCTNMAVDIVNETLGGEVIVKTSSIELSYRETLYPYFDGHLYEQLGTSIIFGTKVDEKATRLFLPIEFQKSLQKAKYNGKPLSDSGTLLMAYKNKGQFSWFNNWYTYIVLLIVVIVVNKNIISFIYLGILGFIGLFFTIAGWYSEHVELANNYNALLFNPLILLLLFFHFRKHDKLVVGISLFCILAVAAYLVVIMDKIHLLIVTPIVITNLILFWRYAGRSYERIKR